METDPNVLRFLSVYKENGFSPLHAMQSLAESYYSSGYTVANFNDDSGPCRIHVFLKDGSVVNWNHPDAIFWQPADRNPSTPALKIGPYWENKNAEDS